VVAPGPVVAPRSWHPTLRPTTFPASPIRESRMSRRWLALAVLAYTVAGWWLPQGPPLGFPLWVALLLTVEAAAVAVFAARCRGARLPEAMRAVTWKRVGVTLVAIVATDVFLRAFLAWKAQLPLWRPYSFDLTLAVLDHRVHRTELWTWLTVPRVLPVYEAVYAAWFSVLAVVVTWMAWRADRRYLLAFALTWIGLGTVMPLFLPAAGPLFLGDLTGDARFAGLEARLPPFTREARDALWALYHTGRPSSISAFPSLHVAMPWLATLAAWRVSRPVAGLLAAYTLLVLLASVGLGWHYGVDGEASLVLVPLVWWVAGRALASPSQPRIRGDIIAPASPETQSVLTKEPA
jgi:hypothetical protein